MVAYLGEIRELNAAGVLKKFLDYRWYVYRGLTLASIFLSRA